MNLSLATFECSLFFKKLSNKHIIQYTNIASVKNAKAYNTLTNDGNISACTLCLV